MSKLTQKYEISVWDVQVQQETKLAIIGANDMLTPARAQSPQLKRNINGTKTLTFSLFTKYVDEIDGERKINPFCNIIHNETRIKLKWKEKWYEFIVKNISEDSENHKNTYVAEDAFISELSRKGFNIELSTDVGGNSGTIIELEDKILENSDWKVDKENSIVGPQLKEDTLVKLIVTKEIEAKQKCEFDENGVFKITDKDFKIPVNSIIYGFYSSIYKKDSFFQFFYNEDGYEFRDDGFIINCPIYCISDYEYAGELPESTSKNEITTYKGKKLIRTQESHYDSVIKNYVKHYYSSNNKEIYGYTETEYVTDEFVNNLATNGKDFVTDVGWYSLLEESKDEANSEIEFYTYPSINTVLEKLRKNKSVDSKSYIRITPNTNQSGAYLFYNTGFEDNKTFIETLSDGQKFVIRLKYGYKLNNSKNDEPIDMQINKNRLVSGLNVSLCEYKIDENGYPIPTSVIFKTRLDGNAENAFKKDGDYWTAICECNKSYSKLKLIEANIGLFFSYDFNGSGKITKSNLKKYSFCIEEFEFFEFKERVIESKDTDREYYLPKETVSGEAKIKYNYFLADQEYEEFDDIEFLYRGYKEKNYKQKYIPDYQQIRVIEEKESNIFNLTQTLCESFETWADFVVEHDDLGYIKKDSNGDFIKKIVFKPYVGKENWSGFHYKTNLKSIQRVTESKQITTKSIVKPNYNEFAPSGFCTIAYSDENPSGESFIYDFRYYENQNILNSKTVLEDLQGKKGLYPQLKELNKRIQDEITKRTEISAQLLYLEKDKELYSAKVAELQTSIATNKKDFKLLTGTSYEKFPKSSNKEEYLELPEVSGNFLVILKEINELQKAQKKYNEVKKQYNTEKKNYKTSVNKIKDLTKQKEKLILDFETKYAPFIQEGTWISNEYIDHNLYYIDAKVVAATSALPQVTYTINVLDLSSMEEFKNYNVEIGDKTYITDPEFFGYIEDQGFYTPRRQEVIISEMVEELEEPEKNKFTVQNFKTQFEDIFHRITAATQQLKLNEGAYQRASKAFSNQGLNSEKVQDSFNSSNFTLTNNTNQWDTQGFISENSQSKQSIKIHDGAIMISGAVSANNSGNAMNRSSKEVENYSLEITEETSTASYNASPASTAPEAWTKIITSKGINANYIYAGQIDAGKINIVTELKTNEDQDLEYAVAFDKDGLSMYGYDTGKKIRLRLGKVLEDDALTELYGLQLYNENGEQTFRTDSEGNITITGTIVAGSGMIGGWGIEEDRLAHYTNDDLIDAFISTEPGEEYSVNDYSNNDWRILLGIEGNTGNFGVTSTGNLFANGVDIKDGNISIGDIFKVTSNGGKDQAMTYGLNIKLNPENQNQEIVIESDDRVIGIRERRQDGKGWTWKTILGDLTNATLGGKPISDYGITGYGLCTENGLFSGTIVASSGTIGGWIITEDELLKEPEEHYKMVLGKNKNSINEANTIFTLEDIGAIPLANKRYFVFKGLIKDENGEFPTYEYDTYNGFKVPDEYDATKEQKEVIGDSFPRYIFYKLYNRIPKDQADALALVALVLSMAAAKIYNSDAMDNLIIGQNSLIRLLKDDKIIYTLNKEGKTLSYLDRYIVDPKEEDEKYRYPFFGSLDSFITLITKQEDEEVEEIGKNKHYLENILGIKNSDGAIWKIFLNDNYIYEDSIIKTRKNRFSLGVKTLKNETGVLSLQFENTDYGESQFYFYFNGVSQLPKFDEEEKIVDYEKTVVKCDLGTKAYPWGGLYLSENAVVQNIHPIGSIIITATNENPSSKLGGEWELIKKSFISKSVAENRNADTPGDEARVKVRINSARAENFINFTFTITMLKSISGRTKLCYLDYALHGMKASGSRFSDDNNNTTVRAVGSEGNVSEFKLFNGSGDNGFYINSNQKAAAGETFSISMTIFLDPDYMEDEHCDKFYWRRKS